MRTLTTRALALALPLVAAACSGSSGGGGATVFVAPVAPGRGDGSSWEHAFTDLQGALAAAAPGSEVWVASGTYRPGPPGSDRETSFFLPDRVTVRGGFSGTESSAGERDPQAPPSILDGDLNGDDGADFTNRADNCYHVLRALDLEEAMLEGFTIRGGYADGPNLGFDGVSPDRGSAIQSFHAHLHVEACNFVENWAVNHAAVDDHGGGVYVDCNFVGNYAGLLGAALYFHGDVAGRAEGCRFLGNVTPGQGAGVYTRSTTPETQIVDCFFVGNRAERGAGVYFAEGSASQVIRGYFDENVATIGGGGLYADASTGTVSDCTFLANSAGTDDLSGGGGAGGSGGGGIWISGGAPLVERCVFRWNAASFGAGVYFNDVSSGTVRHCEFSSNQAFEAGGLYSLESPVTVEGCLFFDNVADGGAFSVGGGVSVYFADATLSDCLFVQNRAQLGGGGLYTEGEEPVITNCVFRANEAFGSPQGWGGGYMAGYFTHAELSGCLFESNRASEGGAVFAITFAEPRLVNATLVANASDGSGGLHAFPDAVVTLANSIVWANAGAQVGGPGTLMAEHCCVEGGLGGTGNFDLDPGFLAMPLPGVDGILGSFDDVPGDLRLRASSPCLDSGDNGWLAPHYEHDLEGHPRRVDDPLAPDTGTGRAPLVDRGVYERAPSR